MGGITQGALSMVALPGTTMDTDWTSGIMNTLMVSLGNCLGTTNKFRSLVVPLVLLFKDADDCTSWDFYYCDETP